MAREMNIAIISSTLIISSKEHRECRSHFKAIRELNYTNGGVQTNGSQLRVKMKKLLVQCERKLRIPKTKRTT